MAIPVELFFVFMLAHLLPAFLDDASHDLASFPFWINPRSHWFESSAHPEVLEVW